MPPHPTGLPVWIRTRRGITSRQQRCSGGSRKKLETRSDRVWVALSIPQGRCLGRLQGTEDRGRFELSPAETARRRDSWGLRARRGPLDLVPAVVRESQGPTESRGLGDQHRDEAPDCRIGRLRGFREAGRQRRRESRHRQPLTANRWEAVYLQQTRLSVCGNPRIIAR